MTSIGNNSIEKSKVETLLNTDKKIINDTVKIDSSKVVVINKDKLSSSIKVGQIPANNNSLASSDNKKDNVLRVSGHSFSNIVEVNNVSDVKEATDITNKNGIDEIFFKDMENNKLYVAFGKAENKGQLNLDTNVLKENHIGDFNGKKVKILKIDNEINGKWEGCKGQFVSTWKSLVDSGENGLTKSVSEIGTTLVALYVGKSVIQGSVDAIKQGNNVVKAADGVVKSASGVGKVVDKGLSTGKIIMGSVKSSFSQLATGAIVAGAFVGVISVGLGVKGYINGATVKNNYDTLQMITKENLNIQKQDIKYIN